MSNIVANRNASTDKDEEEGLPAIASKFSWPEDKWRKKVCELIDFKVTLKKMFNYLPEYLFNLSCSRSTRA